MKNTIIMKAYSHIFFLGFILCVTNLLVNAQDNKIIKKVVNDNHLKGSSFQSDISNSLAIPDNQMVLKAVDFIEQGKKIYDVVSDQTFAKTINATADDSAYVYIWDTDWSLKYRIYYLFNALSIEILQEKLNPDASWSNYSKRVLEFYNTGYFRKETESYWKSSVSDWKIGYFEEYNTEGRLTEIFSKNWNDTTEEFTEGYRIVSTYKKDTLLETELYQEWDVASKGWKNLVRINQSFNANDLISNTTQSVWKEGDWVNDYSIDYEFDAFGNLVTETSQDWDTVGTKWINDVQILRQYNSLGNITNVVRRKWDAGLSAWVNDINRIISYNTFFQVSSDLIQTWNSSSWIDSLKTTYTYTDEGDISQYLEQVWSGSIWVNFYREVYAYKSTEVTIKIDNWDTDGSTWENDIVVTYTLDEFGYIMVEQHDFWNTISSAYETGYYDKYDEYGRNPEYFEKFWNDSLNKFTEGIRILETYYGNTGWEKQVIIQVWDTLALDWKNEQKTDYFWSPALSTEQVKQSGTYKIYPSPFNNLINIEATDILESTGTLKIFDLNGRVVSELELTGRKTTIDLSHLKNGVYLAEISAKDGKSVIKLIKY